MMGDGLMNKCYICSQAATVRELPSRYNVLRHEGCMCGPYVIDSQHKLTRFNNSHEMEQYPTERLSALIRERFIHGLAPPLLYWLDHGGVEPPLIAGTYPVEVINWIKFSWPGSVDDQMDRGLVNLATLSDEGGKKLTLDIDQIQRILFAKSHGETEFIAQALVEANRLKYHLRSPNPVERECTVTAGGWRRIAELKHPQADRKTPVFVAMWFADEMAGIYESAISPGVQQAGYKVTRVDIEHHNDYIMNKVLGDIRVAPYVVADFTGHRPGVYFEAGFARGLNIPVIHTCREDHFEKAHFDIKQINTVRWKDANELREKLLAHIRGSIGEGPYVDRR